MCHSGCYGPLPGSGHPALSSAASLYPSRNATPASKQGCWSLSRATQREEDKRFAFQKAVWVFPADS